jgi:hypothetical protein
MDVFADDCHVEDFEHVIFHLDNFFVLDEVEVLMPSWLG